MMELITGLLGVGIGGIITYYFSTRLLRKQLDFQSAYDFVSKNYLPLLGAIEEYQYSVLVYSKIKTGQKIQNMTKEYAKRMYCNSFISLAEASENVIKSGLYLVITHIDNTLGSYLMGIYYNTKGTKSKITNDIFSQNTGVDTLESEMFLSPRLINELKSKLSKLSIPTIVNEYNRVMKKGFKSKEKS